jgi:glucokinase
MKSKTMMILSGDIGGTSTRMQLTEFDRDEQMHLLKSIHYSNQNFASFSDIIDTFLKETAIQKKQISSICFGVAGPIINGNVQFTNLLWAINSDDLKTQFDLQHVSLINDFEAIGYGIETLTKNDIETLQEAEPREKGLKTFVGAGTGLGVGFMTFFDDSCRVHPTEGGHIDFAPTDDIQVELLNYLRKKYHRVSFERLLSGPGLVNIYRFVRDNKIFKEEENAELRFLLESEQEIDIAATISEYAIKHKDILAIRALDIFIRIYGSFVGDLALSMFPYGGIYIVGGIAPKLLPQIQQGGFMERYLDKGRVSGVLKNFPIYVVTNTKVGLQGAAIYAHKNLEF